MEPRKRRYRDLNEFLFLNRNANGPEGQQVKKKDLANRLGIWNSKLTRLLNPETYAVALDEPLIEAIADVLHQTPDYVRNQYRKFPLANVA